MGDLGLMGMHVPGMTWREMREAAVLAEELGYSCLTMGESWGEDALTSLAQLAAVTSRIRIGTSIVPVFARSPANLAMSALNIDRMSGGRFFLGLGTSGRLVIEDFHGEKFAKPLTRMREYIDIVRKAARGERLDHDGEFFHIKRFQLRFTPERASLPIYIAALSPPSLRLTGELADGWLPFMYPRRCLSQGKALLREGAARAGGGERRIAIYPSVPTVVAADPKEARAGAAWFVSFYLTTMGPLYRRSLARQGFEKEVDVVLAANTPRFTGAVPPEAETLLDELTVFGAPAEARARLSEWHAAGADMPMVFIRPNLSPEEIERTLSAFAPMLKSQRGGR